MYYIYFLGKDVNASEKAKRLSLCFSRTAKWCECDTHSIYRDVNNLIAPKRYISGTWFLSDFFSTRQVEYVDVKKN